MENKNFEGTVSSLFSGMKGFMTTKTVVGDAININDTIILPLVDVSFGMAAGAKNTADTACKESCTGGMGGKMSPSAVLVIKDGACKLVNIKNQDTVTKLIDMIPDILDKFSKKEQNNNSDEMTDEEIIDVAKNSVENN